MFRVSTAARIPAVSRARSIADQTQSASLGTPLRAVRREALPLSTERGNSRIQLSEGELVVDPRIVLAALWVAVMLIYLLGDVLRMFAGHFEPGKIQGRDATPGMWLLVALLMLTPVAMVVLSLVVPFPAIRWLTTGAAGFLVVFNIAGLPYVGWYDNFLIIVSLAVKGLAIWLAWSSLG